jgi:tetratricopeptide (TPR) repeat protein
MNLSSLRLALAAFERAVTLDPRYARAWAGLADAANFLSWFGGLAPEESARRGREAAEKALEIAPSLAEAQDALGFVLFYHDFALVEAEARLKRALELQPGLAMSHYWYAGLLSASGKHEEAIARIRAAQELDPLSPLVNADAGWYYFYARRYSEAIEECRRIVRIDPEYAWAHQCIVAAARKAGREEDVLESRKELARLQERTPDEAPPYRSPYALALERLGLGDRAGSLDALEEAYEERDPFLVNAGVDPRLDELHGEPRFRRLLFSLFEGTDVPCLPGPDGPPCEAPRAAGTRSGR